MILQPRIEMTAAAWSAGEIHRLHEPAGARCSIARSVNLHVRCEAAAGEINGRWVEELRNECYRTLRAETEGGRTVALDLCHVSSIDAAGLELLQELTTRRVALTNCSPYLDEILKDVADVDR